MIPALPPALGYGDGSTISTIYTQALTSNNSGDEGFTYRVEVAVTAPGGRRLRVTFAASTAGTFICDHCSIGISAGSGATIGIPTELFFGGKPGFSLASSGTITSDWLNFGPISASDSLVVIMDLTSGGSGGNARFVSGGGTTFYKAATASYNLATVSSLSFVIDVDGVFSIEVQ